MSTAEQLLLRIDATTESLRRELRRAEQQVGTSAPRMTREVQRVEQSFDGLNRMGATLRRTLGALGVAFSVQQLRSFARDAITTGDSIAKMADSIGIGTDALQELRFAAGRAGVETNTLELGLLRLSREIGNAQRGLGTSARGFEQLGKALGRTIDLSAGTEAVLTDVIEALGNIEDATLRNSLAQEIFGRSAQQMSVFLRQGSRDIGAARKEARDLGLVLGDPLLRGAERLHDQLEDLNQVLRVNMQQGLLRSLTSDTESLSDVIRDQRLHRGLQAVGAGIGAIASEARAAVQQLGRLAELVEDLSLEGLGGFLSNLPGARALGFGIELGAQIGANLRGAATVHEQAAHQILDLTRQIADAEDRLAEARARGSGARTIAARESHIASLEAERAALQAVFDPMHDVVEGTVDLARTTRRATVDLDDFTTTTTRARKPVDELARAYEALRARLDPLGEAQRSYAGDLATLNRAYDRGLVSAGDFTDQLGRLSEGYQDALDPLGAIVRELEEERSQISMTEAERDSHARMLEIENRLRDQGVILIGRERERLQGLVETIRNESEARREAEEEARAQAAPAVQFTPAAKAYAAALLAEIFAEEKAA